MYNVTKTESKRYTNCFQKLLLSLSFKLYQRIYPFTLSIRVGF